MSKSQQRFKLSMNVCLDIFWTILLPSLVRWWSIMSWSVTWFCYLQGHGHKQNKGSQTLMRTCKQQTQHLEKKCVQANMTLHKPTAIFKEQARMSVVQLLPVAHTAEFCTTSLMNYSTSFSTPPSLGPSTAINMKLSTWPSIKHDHCFVFMQFCMLKPCSQYMEHCWLV